MNASAFLAEWGVVLAIIGMALVTYLWRAGGYFLMGFVKPHPRITRALDALPGSVILATVLPIALKTGSAAFVALGLSIALMLAFRNDLIAVAGGLSLAILLRLLGF